MPLAPSPRPSTPRRLGHVPALDGLRGLAVLLVFGYHLPATAVPGGSVGVDVFFALSGFLITALLLQRVADRPGQRRRELLAFYLRRAARLGPALVALLTVWGLLWLTTTGHGVFNTAVGRSPHTPTVPARTNLQGLLAVLSYSYNWLSAVHRPVPLVFGHLWSLSVEEQFYLVWPLLLIALLLVRPRRRYAAVVTLIVLSAAAATLHSPAHRHAWAYYGTDARAQGLLLGALAALAWSSGRLSVPRWGRRLVGLVGAGVLAWLCWQVDERGWLAGHGGLTLAALASTAVVVAVVDGPTPVGRWLLHGPVLQWLGKRSYALYLWSFPVIMWTAALPTWPQAAVAGALTAAAAEVSWRLVETPVQRWARARLDRGGRARPAAGRAAAFAARRLGASTG